LFFSKNEAQVRKCASILRIALRDRYPQLGSFPKISLSLKRKRLFRSLSFRDTGKRGK
jgi:hypothetical protein